VTVDVLLVSLYGDAAHDDVEKPSCVARVKHRCESMLKVWPHNYQRSQENVDYEDSKDRHAPIEQEPAALCIQQEKSLSGFVDDDYIFLHKNFVHLDKGFVGIGVLLRW